MILLQKLFLVVFICLIQKLSAKSFNSIGHHAVTSSPLFSPASSLGDSSHGQNPVSTTTPHYEKSVPVEHIQSYNFSGPGSQKSNIHIHIELPKLDHELQDLLHELSSQLKEGIHQLQNPLAQSQPPAQEQQHRPQPTSKPVKSHYIVNVDKKPALEKVNFEKENPESLQKFIELLHQQDSAPLIDLTSDARRTFNIGGEGFLNIGTSGQANANGGVQTAYNEDGFSLNGGLHGNTNGKSDGSGAIKGSVGSKGGAGIFEELGAAVDRMINGNYDWGLEGEAEGDYGDWGYGGDIGSSGGLNGEISGGFSGGLNIHG